MVTGKERSYVGVWHGMSTNTSSGMNDEDISWSGKKEMRNGLAELSSPLHSLSLSLTHSHTHVNIMHFLFHISQSNKN